MAELSPKHRRALFFLAAESFTRGWQITAAGRQAFREGWYGVGDRSVLGETATIALPSFPAD